MGADKKGTHMNLDKLCQWIAFRLPLRLVYHALIRGWAHATSGPCGLDATTVTTDEMIERWGYKACITRGH